MCYLDVIRQFSEGSHFSLRFISVSLGRLLWRGRNIRRRRVENHERSSFPMILGLLLGTRRLLRATSFDVVSGAILRCHVAFVNF
jgi:hypothetical protein